MTNSPQKDHIGRSTGQKKEKCEAFLRVQKNVPEQNRTKGV